jgi:hypothetical protein
MTERDAATAGEDGALLELKLVGDISGQFYVPRYQRGYRWGAVEVGRLLDDIWESKGESYSLQPVVVKRRSESDWELVDGQQRLTTLYLIFLYMQREGLQNAGPTYSMAYETRPGSQSYLNELDPERRDSNIDYFHIFTAYECIRTWFENHGQRRQHVANKFYGYLFESVRVIWYEAPHELDSTTLFTRLNVGRIPLTDAELVKALLLSRSRGGAGKTDRAHEVAAQWDGIERDLRAPDVWAFVAGTSAEDSPTRINLLLDTLAGGPRGRERPLFHTFGALRQRIEKSSPEAVWNDVVDLHARVLGWYENRDLYHKIGYLVAVGHDFSSLVSLAQNRTKSSFEALLDERIRTTLELTPSGVTELSYETDAHKEKCSRVLLLMNVETVRQMEHSSERYSFRLHRSGSWSLEHIHAQNAETLTKAEQWKQWLRLHGEALATLPNVDEERRDALIARIEAVSDDIGREAFHSLAREVTDLFTIGDESGQATLHSVHSISNLALLSSGDNSALGNSVFEVKRRRMLELDRRGAYIPVCTRQVFLKYYTDANAQQIHFWGTQDRESYLAAILAPTNGGIGSYLRPEEREA